jgi:DNA-binding transcriptional LysR family regulator
VRLGAIATIQTDALPHVLRRLRDRHRALEVVVSMHDSDQLVDELRAGRIDAAALVRPERGGSTRLAWQDLTQQPFVMLVPADTPPAAPPELLQRLDWIRYDPALTGGRIAAAWVKRIGPHARCAMTVQSIDAIVAMVSARLGVSIVPRPRTALLAAHGVREVKLGRGAPTRQIALARRRADAGNRNIDALHAAFATVYRERAAAG